MLWNDFFSWGDGELWADRGWFMLLLHHFIQWSSVLASTDWPQAVPQHLNCQERWIPDKRWLKRLILNTAKNSEHNKPNPEYGTDIILPDSVDKGHISLLVSCAPATSHMSHSCHFNLWGECTSCCRKWLHAPQFHYYQWVKWSTTWFQHFWNPNTLFLLVIWLSTIFIWKSISNVFFKKLNFLS